MKVIPHSSQEKIILGGDAIKIYVKAVPDKNKANLAVIKLLKKECGLRVEIVSGATGRKKVLGVI